MGPRHALRECLLLDLLLSASPGPEILDAGAGQGTMSTRLERLRYEVTSTDVSGSAVEVLRDRLAGSVVEACASTGFIVHHCLGWGFPFSRLYHRHVYERYLDRHGPVRPDGRRRPLVAAVGALLQVDRLFVGVERGALGYLLLATRP